MSDIQLVSVDSAGNQGTPAGDFGFLGSDHPVISADGRFVLFFSLSDNLAPGDTNGTIDLLVKDMQTGAVTNLSALHFGTGTEIPITQDGRYIAFTVDGINGVGAFIKDLDTGSVVLRNGTGYDVSISADGNYFAYKGADAIYLKDLQTGVTTLVSNDSEGGPVDARNPSISSDGRYVAFQSSVDNLVSDDNNGDADIFVKDLQSGNIVRASVDSDGNEFSQARHPVLSGNGRYVAFAVGDGPGNLYVKDLQSGQLALVGEEGFEFGSYSISSDGRYIAFTSRGDLVPGDTNFTEDVYVKDMQTGELALVSTNSEGVQANNGGATAFSVSISADGHYLAFANVADNLVPDDANGAQDVFRVANPLFVAVNHAPSGTDQTLTTLEDNTYIFTLSDFGFSDPEDNPANSLNAVVVASDPASGSLSNQGISVGAGSIIAMADIAAGHLSFTPAANAQGASYASFDFQVRDNGGTNGGGIDTDPTPNTITIDVAPVNDAPSGSDKTVSTRQDNDYIFTTVDFGFGDPNDSPANNLNNVAIVAGPAAGTLSNEGMAVGAGDVISALDIAAGHLSFIPAANTNGTGYATFDFRVQDDGGTGGGGIDTDPTPKRITIDVTSVSDTQGPTDWNFTLAYNGNFDDANSIAAGTPIGSIGASGDPNSATFSYFFALNAAGAGATQGLNGLSIDRNSGVITTTAAINTSSATWLLASDATGNAFAKQLIINVANSTANTLAVPNGTTVTFALGGGDAITGSNGDDAIATGRGNDDIIGFVGADTVDGGAGTDRILLSASSADLDAALDTQLVNIEVVTAVNAATSVAIDLHRQSESLDIRGSANGDVITGGSGGDTIDAGGGADTIVGFLGIDTAKGGAGSDTLLLLATSADLNAASSNSAGDNRIVGIENISAFGASSGVAIDLSFQRESFTISGSDFADTIVGGLGNDTILGFTAGDNIRGGGGQDTIALTATSPALNAATDDQIRIEKVSAANAASGVAIDLRNQNEFALTIEGSNFGDSITASAGRDSIRGLDGDDVIFAVGPNDDVNGGRGRDTIVVTSTSPLVDRHDASLSGIEAVTATDSPSGVVIDLSSQRDPRISVTGSAFADNIKGSNLDIFGFVGADVIEATGNVLIIRLSETSSDLNAATDAQLVNANWIVSTAQAVTGITIDLHNQSEGFVVGGTSFADVIVGGSGNDLGLQAGGGDDSYYVNSAGDSIFEELDSGIDTAYASGPSFTLLDNNVENLSFVGSGNFTGGGNALSNTIRGGSGNDSLSGAGGDDVLFGLGGQDSISGGAGDDTFVASVGDGSDTYTGNGGSDTYSLAGTTANATINLAAGAASSGDTGVDTLNTIENIVGGAGNDVITVNSQTNVLTGGAGSDTFVFASTQVAGIGANRDHIVDFAAGVDIINVSGIDANGAQAGDPPFAFIGEVTTVSGGLGQLARGELGYHYETDGSGVEQTIVEGNINADANADFQVALAGHQVLTVGDFIL